MFSKTLVLIALLGSNVNAKPMALRKTLETGDNDEFAQESLDLELILEGGERQLFPLLPGTKCPTGHTCRVRNSQKFNVGPMAAGIRATRWTPLAATLDWNSLNNNLNEVVKSNNYCTRRQSMARAAGLVAGVAAATVAKPAYAAETKTVLMGSDSGLLAFVPAKTQICKGDTVKWINNKGGPHNVVFDEDAIPSGVSQEKISMDEQLGDEGDTFSMSFDTAGEYAYYCEPHRGAGMNGMLVVL